MEPCDFVDSETMEILFSQCMRVLPRAGDHVAYTDPEGGKRFYEVSWVTLHATYLGPSVLEEGADVTMTHWVIMLKRKV
jgi:hypothetical protein